MVGESVGGVVGLDEGIFDTLGEIDGILEGYLLGEFVGKSVGIEEGSVETLGLILGSDDGANDGSMEGNSLGHLSHDCGQFLLVISFEQSFL